MGILNQTYITDRAVDVLRDASFSYGIKASSEQKDNYGYIWARDSAVAALAVIANHQEDLFPPIKGSLLQLQRGASKHGQIPSNLLVDNLGNIIRVSFGGPAGRVDASFWWVVAAVLLLQQQPDEAFAETVYAQCEQIFNLAECWEFNGRGLMCIPMSSNWADEYITTGYVLYDQLVRYWATSLAADFFKRDDWNQKALDIKVGIKQHFLLETELDDSVYTRAQQNALKGFDIAEVFVASFSPGGRVEKFDAWSIGLLLMLDIPSQATIQKLNTALLNVFNQNGQKGIPAFWPVITERDSQYKQLRSNHNYSFKNYPGHFHNGGIWPVVNGFVIAGLEIAGQHQTAYLLMDAMHKRLFEHMAQNPFAEYFDYYKGQPGGVNNLCFSASGYLLANAAITAPAAFAGKIFPFRANEDALLNQLMPAAQKLVNYIKLDDNRVTVISVAGESGSGKTTLGKLIKHVLADRGCNVLLLHQDDYFKLPPRQNHENRVKDFTAIGAEEVRLNLIDEHLEVIKTTKANHIMVPHMNWVTDTEESRKTSIEGVNVVIIDGTYTSLLSQVDFRILINTNYEQTRKNRINRNRETVTPFIERVLQRESEIIQSHQTLADVVIDSSFSPVYNFVK